MATQDWTASVKSYGALTAFTSQFARIAAQRLLTDLVSYLATEGPVVRVADFACGTGVAALAFVDEVLRLPDGQRKRAVEIVASDYAEGMLEACRGAFASAFEEGLLEKNRITVSFQRDDLQDLRRYPDGHFSGLLCVFGIMFPPNPDLAARELNRVLSPGCAAHVASWHFNSIVHYCCAVAEHTKKASYGEMLLGMEHAVTQWGSTIRVVKLFVEAGVKYKALSFDFVTMGGFFMPTEGLRSQFLTSPVFTSFGAWDADAAISFLKETYGEQVELSGCALFTRFTASAKTPSEVLTA